MKVHFVMLPTDGGRSHVAVNPDLVRCVQARSATQAEIAVDDHHWLLVDKTMEQVGRDLEIAGR